MVDEFNKEMCEQRHDFLDKRVTDMADDTDKRLTKMEKVIDKIRDRLPVWVTLLLMLLTAALGYALKAQ